MAKAMQGLPFFAFWQVFVDGLLQRAARRSLQDGNQDRTGLSLTKAPPELALADFSHRRMLPVSDRFLSLQVRRPQTNKAPEPGPGSLSMNPWRKLLIRHCEACALTTVWMPWATAQAVAIQ